MEQIKREKLIDREVYRKVKQMSRTEMEDFLHNIYVMGAKAALVKKTDLIAQLKTVNGLGEKRIEAILVALEDMYYDDTLE